VFRFSRWTGEGEAVERGAVLAELGSWSWYDAKSGASQSRQGSHSGSLGFLERAGLGSGVWRFSSSARLGTLADQTRGSDE
jgi:hypothetical protein